MPLRLRAVLLSLLIPAARAFAQDAEPPEPASLIELVTLPGPGHCGACRERRPSTFDRIAILVREGPRMISPILELLRSSEPGTTRDSILSGALGYLVSPIDEEVI